jgi:hypothetical protein
MLFLTPRVSRAGVDRRLWRVLGAGSGRGRLEIGVIDPERIRALRIAEGKRAKTGALDAANGTGSEPYNW